MEENNFEENDNYLVGWFLLTSAVIAVLYLFR
jgi:hypothetical protein